MRTAFNKQIVFYIDDSLRKIEHIIPTLTEQQFWSKPSDKVLSIANQLLHLEGNLSQWVLHYIDGQEYSRNRDQEFVVDTTLTKDQIYQSFQQTIKKVKDVLHKDHDLMTTFVIQGHETNGLGIWIHMVEHFSYHTGQIVYAAKLLQDQEFGFYDDWALNDK